MPWKQGFEYYFNVYLLDLALYLGMTPEQYWYGSPSLLGNYLEAHNRRQKDMISQCWLTGAYVRAAIGSSIQVIGILGEHDKLPEYPSLEEATEQKPKLSAEEIALRQSQLDRINMAMRSYISSMR